MNYTDAEIADALRTQTRNLRGVAVGLRCAFADARQEGWSLGRARYAVKVGIQATHDFAEFQADWAALDGQGARTGRLQTAWNVAQRSLFATKAPPPDSLGAVWQPFSTILRENHSQYAELSANAAKRWMAIKVCLNPEYAYWTRQHGHLSQCVRLLDRMDKRMTALAAQVDEMGPAARVTFLYNFTPAMRRVGMVPA